MSQVAKYKSKPEICISARSLSLLQMAADTLFSFATTETWMMSLFALLRAVKSYTHVSLFYAMQNTLGFGLTGSFFSITGQAVIQFFSFRKSFSC